MLRGYRCVVIAVVGCLTLATSKPQQTTEQTERRAANQVEKPASLAAQLPAIHTIDAAKYEPPCREPQSHDQCDLQAQWTAADAADKAAWWAVVQAVLSAAGIVGLGYSLVLTRRATQIAFEATRDADVALAIAERNALAAAEQVAVARETADRQLRAYVGATAVWLFDEGSEGISVTVSYKNFGQTPATNVSIRATLCLADEAAAKAQTVPAYQIDHGIGLVDPGHGGNATIVPAVPIVLDSPAVAARLIGGERVTLFFAMAYDTIGGAGKTRSGVYYLDCGKQSPDGRYALNIGGQGHQGD